MFDVYDEGIVETKNVKTLIPSIFETMTGEMWPTKQDYEHFNQFLLAHKPLFKEILTHCKRKKEEQT